MADDSKEPSKEADRGLRRRRAADKNGGESGESSSVSEQQLVEEVAIKETSSVSSSLSPGSYWLTRIIFIRSLGFVYCK